MTPLALSGLFSIGEKLIDKLFTSDEDKAKAHLELLRLQQSGELELLKTQLSAIVAEAQSPDPWTSRARPSFMYVMYVLILASIPMGILAAFKPDVADAITKGMTGYLAAIPEPLYVLFGTGYLGYTAARQWGKAKGTDK
jgi:hypothetical protein